MATVINNPGDSNDNTASAVITGLVVIIIVVLFLVYGLPRFRGTTTEVNIPDQINVDTNGGGGQ